jgi:hypothetical protein
MFHEANKVNPLNFTVKLIKAIGAGWCFAHGSTPPSQHHANAAKNNDGQNAFDQGANDFLFHVVSSVE